MMKLKLFLSVSLMTVLKENSTISLCSPVPIHQLGTVAIVTVDDRSTELSLMDNNINTCLTAFELGYSGFHLMAYIHTSGSVPFLRVTLDTSGLACTVPELVVYHQVSMAVEHSEIQYQECSLTETRVSVGTTQQCDFLCYGICPDASVVKIGIQTELLPWRGSGTGSLCGISVSSLWTSRLKSVRIH